MFVFTSKIIVIEKMFLIFVILYINHVVSVVFCGSIKETDSTKVICSDLPETLLTDILGPAYNSRYMSIRQPPEDENYNEEENTSIKRNVGHIPSFYVEEDYEKILDDKPAWVANNHYALDNPHFQESTSRKKRNLKSAKQWECESKINWMDLGPDYFPRYLRTVECVSKLCWYGHFKCKPRSFTVKLLRKRRDMCTTARPGSTIGVSGLPEDLRILWVWEERAVTFCCDCSQ